MKVVNTIIRIAPKFMGTAAESFAKAVLDSMRAAPFDVSLKDLQQRLDDGHEVYAFEFCINDTLVCSVRVVP